MKKSLILLSVCSAVLLSSCGTSSRYAYSTFDDGIYYRPDKDHRQELTADNNEVQSLIEKTRQEAARFSDTIMMASITSKATDPGTPININQVDNWYEYNLLGYDTYCSYWDWRYWDIFGPWGRYSSWYDWYNWYSPWFPGIYDPWYPSYGWAWSFAWNSWGWYGSWWGGPWGWYDPWYGPWGYPVASIHPTYYGKRPATSTSLRAGLTGGNRNAVSGTVRSTSVSSGRGTASRPSVSVVRGRTATASTNRVNSLTASTSGLTGRTYQSASRVNMGERYVSNTGRVNTVGRVSTAGRVGTATSGATFRRASTATSGNFNNISGIRNTTVRNFDRNTSVDRNTNTFYNRNSNTVFDRNTSVNNSSRSTVNTTRSVSRSSFSTGGSRSYSGGGSRGGGGSVRR